MICWANRNIGQVLPFFFGTLKPIRNLFFHKNHLFNPIQLINPIRIMIFRANIYNFYGGKMMQITECQHYSN